MSSDLQRDLIAYRLEQARKVLEEATVLQKGGHLLGTVNRAYYAMFYSIQALLTTRGLKSSKHSGVISLFDREYIKEAQFDKHFSKWLHELFALRQAADYSDTFIVTEGKAQQALEHAKAFVERTAEFLKDSDKQSG